LLGVFENLVGEFVNLLSELLNLVGEFVNLLGEFVNLLGDKENGNSDSSIKIILISAEPCMDRNKLRKAKRENSFLEQIIVQNSSTVTVQEPEIAISSSLAQSCC